MLIFSACTEHCTTYGCNATGAGKCDRCDTGYILGPSNTCESKSGFGVL